MNIRRLTLNDYTAMLTLYKELDALHVEARPDYFAHRDDVYPQEHYSSAVSDPECLFIGAFDTEGNMIAFVRATRWNESGMVKTAKTVCLDNIYVLPSYRRNGIASKLFTEVELWAKEAGAISINLNTWSFNKDAIALYRSMGMTPRQYIFEKKL